MAYGIVHHLHGGTKEQYEASLGAVQVSRESLPEGQIFHAAGASACQAHQGDVAGMQRAHGRNESDLVASVAQSRDGAAQSGQGAQNERATGHRVLGWEGGDGWEISRGARGSARP